MRRLLFAVPTFVMSIALAVAAQAQTPLKVTWKCNAVQPMPAGVPVPGQADRTYTVYQVKCTTDGGEIAGLKQKEGTATEFLDAKPTGGMGHGVFLETLENGDTVAYKYQVSTTTKDRMIQSVSDTWTIASGTGKLKGIKGSGTCKGKGEADGTVTFDCTGAYTMAK